MFERFSDTKYIVWAREVKARDNYRCQICGQSDKLHSHHKNSWNYFWEDRYIVENGVTLCSSCHERFHQIYGRGYNTKYQFEQFKQFMNSIANLAKERK